MISRSPLPARQTAITISRPGGPDVLVSEIIPVPEPGPGEVLVRVAAAGVNAPDLAQRRGVYPPPPGASPLPGLEVSGEVIALGRGVERLALGDAVIALTNGGGYAEYVAVPEGQALALPLGLTWAAGASLPETVFTVSQSLLMRAGVLPGMSVLVHGAAGGIGGMAVQLARLFGATTIGVVSSAEKSDYALSLGAAAVIRHDEEDVVARTLELTGGQGADRIVDIIGGDMLNRNIAAAARFGHIVLISTLAGGTATIEANRLMMKQLTLSGSTLRPQSAEVKARIGRFVADHVLPGFVDGRLKVPRLTLYELENAAEAHRSLEERSFFGKLVLLTRFGRGQTPP